MSVVRRIAIVRHAKSAQAVGQTDHARVLDDRGRREAPELARTLRSLGWEARVVLSSDSERTRETWACMAPELPAPAHVEYFRSLYHAERDAALDALATLADDTRTDGGRGVVYLVGHNPGWSDLVSEVTGVPTEMKTAQAALLEAPAVSYRDALAGRMKLVALVGR